MQTSELKSIVQHYYDEIWSKGDLTLIDALMSPDYVNRDPATPTPNGELFGRDGLKGLVSSFRSAFPDLRMEITGQVAEGETVVSWWTATGTMQGGMHGLPPTGKSGCVTGVTVTRFRDGEIVEDTAHWDTLGLLTQLGYGPGSN